MLCLTQALYDSTAQGLGKSKATVWEALGINVHWGVCGTIVNIVKLQRVMIAAPIVSSRQMRQLDSAVVNRNLAGGPNVKTRDSTRSVSCGGLPT